MLCYHLLPCVAVFIKYRYRFHAHRITHFHEYGNLVFAAVSAYWLQSSYQSRPQKTPTTEGRNFPRFCSCLLRLRRYFELDDAVA